MWENKDTITIEELRLISPNGERLRLIINDVTSNNFWIALWDVWAIPNILEEVWLDLAPENIITEIDHDMIDKKLYNIGRIEWDIHGSPRNFAKKILDEQQKQSLSLADVLSICDGAGVI